MKTLMLLMLSLFSLPVAALQCQTTNEEIMCMDLNEAGAVVCTRRGKAYECRDFYPKLDPQPEPVPEEPDSCWDSGDCDD